MRSVSRWAGVVALVVMTAGSAGAQTWTLQVTPGQEPPTPAILFTNELTGGARPASFGTATFTLSGSGSTLQLSMLATINNIDVTGTQTPFTNDNLTAAHIHASNVTPPPPTRPVVWGFFGTPDNDVAPDNLVITPFTGGLVGGTFSSIWNANEGNNTTLLAQVENLLNGRAYVNFHTSQNPGGEIRGDFNAIVPEPSTYVLMASGLAGLGMIARRRRVR